MKHLHMSGISFSHSRPIHVALEERNRVKNTHTYIHAYIYIHGIHTYITLRTNGSMTEPLKVQCLDIDKEPLKGLNGTILKVPRAEPLKVQN